MQSAIAVIVIGAIGLIVFAAVSPTLFGSFGDTYQQTQAACVYQGERFTGVNTAKDWAGTSYTLSASGSNCGGVQKNRLAADASGSAAAIVYYTPDGVALSVAGDKAGSNGASATTVDANLPAPAAWSQPLTIMSKQSGINRLIITILPLLTVIGAVALLYGWHKNRQMA